MIYVLSIFTQQFFCRVHYIFYEQVNLYEAYLIEAIWVQMGTHNDERKMYLLFSKIFETVKICFGLSLSEFKEKIEWGIECILAI